MYVEHLSSGYWLTELDVIGWSEEYAAMDTADHGDLAEFVYGCTDHPLLMKDRDRAGHVAVYPEESVPSETLVVPGGDRFETFREQVLVAKRGHAEQLFALMDW